MQQSGELADMWGAWHEIGLCLCVDVGGGGVDDTREVGAATLGVGTEEASRAMERATAARTRRHRAFASLVVCVTS